MKNTLSVIVAIVAIFSITASAGEKLACKKVEYSSLRRVLNRLIDRGEIADFDGKVVGDIFDIKEVKFCANHSVEHVRASFYLTTKLKNREQDFRCQTHLKRTVSGNRKSTWTSVETDCVDIHYLGSKDDHHRDSERVGHESPDDVNDEFGSNNRNSSGPDSYDDGSGESSRGDEFGDLLN